MNIVNLWNVVPEGGYIKRLYIPGYLDSAWDIRVSSIIGVVYASSYIRDISI